MNSIDTLLADLAWLRTLARQLARDHDLADEVVQDACSLALRQRPAPQQWRAWLTTVVRNLLHTHRRRRSAEGRRRAALARTHDEAAAAAAGDAQATLQRAEAQQRLAAVVLALDEPYRATVLLRFFEGLPPRRIAARLAVPVATVHSRLQRALQQLRERLDGEFAGRERWLVALAPLWSSARVAPLLLGFVASTLVAVALLVLLVAAPASLAPDVASPTPTVVADAVAPADAGREVVAARGTATPSASANESTTPSATAPAPAAARHPVRGRLVDLAGQPLAGVAMTAVLGEAPAKATAADVWRAFATSDADGWFTGELPATTAMVMAGENRFCTVLMAAWSARPDAELPIVVAAPARRVRGTVLDAGGAVVGNGRVVLRLPGDVFARLPVRLDRALDSGWRSAVGADGRFELAPAPQVEGAVLWVTGDGCEPAGVALDWTRPVDLTIRLERARGGDDELRGTVLRADGTPAAGALVALGVTLATADRDGRFVLRLRRAGEPGDLVALVPGSTAARRERPPGGGRTAAEWGPGLVLQLGPAPARALGRVVDEQGEPIVGAEVWIADPTPFGVLGELPLQVEFVAGGAPLWARAAPPPELPEAGPAAPSADARLRASWQHADEPTASWQFVVSDATGHVTVPGLHARSYVVRGFDPHSGRVGEVRGVRGGGAFTLRIDRTGAGTEWRGRVVSLGGRPLAAVRVQQQIPVFAATTRGPGGRFELVVLRDGRGGVTAADGGFVLADVPSLPSHLLCDGDRVLPMRIDPATFGDPRALVITAEARCVVDVVLADANEADAVAAVDRDGKPLAMVIAHHNTFDVRSSVPLRAGRSGSFAVGERAARLVLSRRGVRGRTIEVSPLPGQTVTVH